MYMMSTVIFIFCATIIGLIRYQQRPDIVFSLAFLSVYLLDLVSTEQVISSLSNQGLLTLILLMMCSLSLEKTRLLRMVGARVIKENFTQTWVRLFGMTVLSSAFLNNTAVVSTMLAPIRNNPHHPAGKLLMPLSYAAILGGTLTLVGTSTNLIVNSLVVESGLPSLKFFDFTSVGLCVVFGCGAILFLLRNTLPDHQPKQENMSEYFIDAEVEPGSSMIGKSIDDNGLRHLESLFLVEILRKDHLVSPVSPKEVIQESDRLIFSGDVTKVMQLQHFDGLTMFAHQNGLPLDNLTEVIVRQESILPGRTLKHIGFRSLFDAAVVAIRRDGIPVSGKLGEVEIKAGDSLVLAVGEDFKQRSNINKNFILLSGVVPEEALTGFKEALSIGGFIGAIALSAFGVVSLFKALVLLFGLLLLSGCLSRAEVVRRLPVKLWVIISSALCLAYALDNQGLSHYFSNLEQMTGATVSPFVALVIIYVLTWLFTELVTNNAAAALLFPIAYGFALATQSDPTAFIMAVAFGASASFISPYGYQTNLMVFNAGSYALKDFVKLGLPVSLAYGVIVLTAIPLFYGF